MDERDIWRSAKLLIDQYGADAATHGAIRADQLIEAETFRACMSGSGC